MPYLKFEGKSFVENHHLIVPYSQLLPVAQNSLTDKPSLKDNLIIHGDNLIALKALLPIYEGKVKCIYIDPPYNTGNEGWQYNDNVNSPKHREWLGKVVDREDLQRHDKWLCMMMPRLRLLKELLREDGVIFVSIDDNEIYHLRLLMDEIFGEPNFLGIFVWKRRSGANDPQKYISRDHEYIIGFTNSPDTKLNGILKDFSNYSNPDNDPRGDWTRGDLTCGKTDEERPNLYYTITDPNTGTKYPANPNRVWVYEPQRMQKLISENKVLFPKNGEGVPQYKRFKSEVKSDRKPVSTWVETMTLSVKDLFEEQFEDDVSILQVPMNQQGTKDLRELFPKQDFLYPKPVGLVRELLRQATSDNDIILDSFAGSGTTAQAVLELNQEDGGNRQFILVEMEDYANTLTAERVRRVIKGVRNAKSEALKKGLRGAFSYYELGEPIDIQQLFNKEGLPNYEDLARYLFYMATGEEFDPQQVQRANNYVGESKDYHIFLFYEPDWNRLMDMGLTYKDLEALPFSDTSKTRLVYAPARYVDEDDLNAFNAKFLRLPYDIYRYLGRKDAN